MSITAKNASLAGAGLIFAWSAISGASVTGTLRDAATGVKPVTTDAFPITGGSVNAVLDSSPVSSGVAGIAADARLYNGRPYGWGSSGKTRNDCSGLVNQVTGRDLGLAIPGYRNGKYPGHGPITTQWFAWNGLDTIPESEAQANDIIVWLTHMGIVLGPNQMISALNPALGTKITTFKEAAPPFEPMRIRRYK